MQRLHLSSTLTAFEQKPYTWFKIEPVAVVILPAGLSDQNPIWTPLSVICIPAVPSWSPLWPWMWRWYIPLNCFCRDETYYGGGFMRRRLDSWLSELSVQLRGQKSTSWWLSKTSLKSEIKYINTSFFDQPLCPAWCRMSAPEVNNLYSPGCFCGWTDGWWMFSN